MCHYHTIEVFAFLSFLSILLLYYSELFRAIIFQWEKLSVLFFARLFRTKLFCFLMMWTSWWSLLRVPNNRSLSRAKSIWVIPFKCWAFKLILNSFESVQQHKIVLFCKQYETEFFPLYTTVIRYPKVLCFFLVISRWWWWLERPLGAVETLKKRCVFSSG